MITQYNVSVTGVSESWERQDLPLKDLIQMENYRVITNICQRQYRGGKPALIIDERKYHIKELCPNPITVPLGVEAVWALLKPKIRRKNSKVNFIAVCSYYYAGPNSCSKDIYWAISIEYSFGFPWAPWIPWPYCVESILCLLASH